MMVRVLLAAIVARSSNAFLQSATRTARRSLAARALPPHLETVKADVAGGDALLLDVREPHEWAAAHFATATFSAAIKVASDVAAIGWAHLVCCNSFTCECRGDGVLGVRCPRERVCPST